MKLGELLKAKRDALGLTLAEVGDAAGMSKGHLHDLESGRHHSPGILMCARLSVVLGVPVAVMASAALESAMESGV